MASTTQVRLFCLLPSYQKDHDVIHHVSCEADWGWTP